jgi:hypothetical protein
VTAPWPDLRISLSEAVAARPHPASSDVQPEHPEWQLRVKSDCGRERRPRSGLPWPADSTTAQVLFGSGPQHEVAALQPAARGVGTERPVVRREDANSRWGAPS